MKYNVAIWVLLVCLSSSFAFAQLNIDQPFTFKDLAFPEVVAGSSQGSNFQTLVTVSNRGNMATYDGTAYLRYGKGQEWNPIVNGVRISNGQFPVSIPPKTTKTYLVTDSSLAGGGMFISNVDEDTPSLTSYIEGNLAYFISAGGVTTDSIGVLPAAPFVAASIPFDDFQSVCLALMNGDFAERTAKVTMKLYSDGGTLLASYDSETNQDYPSLLWQEQRACYLYQLFPSITSLASGRVEITSDIPILGTALKQTTSGQYSSLPLGSTIRTYSVSTTQAGVGLTRIALWTHGPFVNGYLILTYQNQQEFALVYGQISGEGANQTLNLHFDSKSEVFLNYQITGFAKTNAGFKWDNGSFAGSYFVYVMDVDQLETGAFSATLAIP